MRTYSFLLKWTAPAPKRACIGIYKIVSEAVMPMKAVKGLLGSRPRRYASAAHRVSP